MNDKKLLTIGEIAKLTDASIKSLRYYEEIGILKPVFINPDTGYRYYSLNQINLIWIFQLCIEFDIPLKELTRFIENFETINYKGLLEYGKEIAKKKLDTLQKGLNFIEKNLSELELFHHFPSGEIYERTVDEKYFLTYPMTRFPEEDDLYKISSLLFKQLEKTSNYSYEELHEYGYLYEHLENETKRYLFLEVSKNMADHLEHISYIPANRFSCLQSPRSQIEEAQEIFGAAPPFLAIEIEVFSGQFKINEPGRELRIVSL